MGDGEKDTPTKGTPANSSLNIQQRNSDAPADAALDTRKDVKAWERDDAPAGSTEGSLLAKDENGKDVVSGPTHYTHLANGQVVGTYGIGTHHTDEGLNDGRPVPVVAHFAG